MDIDGYGDLDLILAKEFERKVILINTGDGTLVDETEDRFPDIARDSEDIAVADFDGDGDLDIIFVSEDDEKNEFYVNDGNAVFSIDSTIIPVDGISNAVVAADINKDGWPDLLIGNRGQNILLFNDQNGGFTDVTADRMPSDGATTQDIELADYDKDGDLDLFEANETQNRILINNGASFTDQTSALLPAVEDQTRDVNLGDFDGDGDLDILYANVSFGNVGDPQNRLLRFNGSSFHEATNLLPPSPLSSVDADFVDLDNDGDLDILAGNRINGPLQVALLYDEEKLRYIDFTSTLLPGIDIYVFDFVTADFNNDGSVDIYFCNFGMFDGYVHGNIQ